MLGQTSGSQQRQATSLLYSGEQFDSTLQRYHLRARNYNQANGQFTTLDPYAGNLHDPQSLHKYAYCHTDPVNGIDPSGEFTVGEILTVSSISSAIGLVMGATYGLLKTRSFWGAAKYAAWGAVSGFIITALIMSAGAGISYLIGGAVSESVAAASLALIWGLFAVYSSWNALQMAQTDAEYQAALFALAISVVFLVVGVKGLNTRISQTRGPQGPRIFSKSIRRPYVERVKSAAGEVCRECGQRLVPATKPMKGISPNPLEMQLDHFYPYARGGNSSPANVQPLCRTCNARLSDSLKFSPFEWLRAFVDIGQYVKEECNDD